MKRPAKLILLGLAAILVALGAVALVVWCNSAIVDGHPAPTKGIIMGLDLGAQAFRTDWNQYPPSHFTDEPYDMQEHGGAGLLAYYLMGPKAAGWGGEDPQVLPFGGTSSASYPTYARIDWKYIVVTKEMRPIGFNDAYRPPKKILYFRAEPGREPLFDVHDSPVDPTCQTGFASQEHFEMSVKRKGPDGTMQWPRRDYLLISAGPDRWFGCVVEQQGKTRAAQPGEEIDVVCDDIANWYN